MDIIRIIKEEIENSTCSNYFNMDGIRQYVEFDMPLYSIINKDKTAELTYISPKQYIYNIARGFGGLSYDDAISHVGQHLVDKYAEDMKKGDKFPIPYYRHNKSDQEGRHRALASMKNGCELIPVIKFIDLNYVKKLDILEPLEGLSQEEVNKIFIEKGFKNGISDKCYMDLQRFFEND